MAKILFFLGPEYGPSAFGPSGSAYHDVAEGPPEIPMVVLDTNIECEKSFMVVYLKWVYKF